MNDSPSSQLDTLSSGEVRKILLSDLLLDKDNPRFGFQDGRVNQTEILDFIVETFGVDDVLSSLAVNGYFAAEPVVCRKEKGTEHYIVAEGNRRLAACLILTGDERASNQRKRTADYQKIHAEHGSQPIAKIPAIVVNAEKNDRALLSYLGVRHIAAAQPWDSYAKAVWISRVVQESGLSIEDAAAMIGDKHKTLSRLLEGYNFIQQLILNDRFKPENSIRKGRGSNTQYPFSWVYTILGYNSVRKFIEIVGNPSAVEQVPHSKLKDAALLTTAMFGDRNRGQSSAVSDSRQLGQLAAAVEDPMKVELLRKGKTLEEIQTLTQPLDERLSAGLLDAQEILRDLNNRLTEQDPSPATAKKYAGHSTSVKKLATEVDRRIQGAAGDGSEL